MTTFIDTNVLIYLLDEQADHHEWSREQLDVCRGRGPALISDIVYCEFAVGMASQEAVDLAISELAIERIAATDEVLFRAAMAFKEYRGSDREIKRVLPDFLVGAIADIYHAPLLTNNSADFTKYFPKLELITP